MTQESTNIRQYETSLIIMGIKTKIPMRYITSTSKNLSLTLCAVGKDLDQGGWDVK